MIKLISPADGAVVRLVPEKIREYIRAPKNDPVSNVDFLNLRETADDLSYPLPAVLECGEKDAVICVVSPDGKEARYDAPDGKAEVYNLLAGAKYRWRAEKDGEVSETFTFVTDAVPRMLYIDGISNARDFGGFACEGGRVRQGVIYRTSEMDTHVSISESGKEALYALGIKTDLDIRGIIGEARAPALDTERVAWINAPIAAYGELFTEENTRLFGKCFSLIADPSLYPMIVHCWGGIDRTGCLLFILGAALGVSEDDLSLDYEMSSFSRWGRRSRYSEQFLEFRRGLAAFGDNLKSAAEGYIAAAGVPEGALARARDALVEKVEK